jgi:hypothetical protein
LARIIPPGFEPTSTSPGEAEVFRRLRDDHETAGWTVLHSLDLAEHSRQVSGEIDFVIIVPALGVLCLEVKGHGRVARQADGAWVLGNDAPSYRGPFKQAAAAMHSLRRTIFDRDHRLGSILFWSAVCFPSVEFRLSAPAEWHPWQVIDSRSLRSGSIAKVIVGVLESARRHVLASGSGQWLRDSGARPSSADVASLVELLRPAFEMFQAPRVRRADRAGELLHYTQEQYAALDALEANSRVVFEGPAGTGKTMLALEAARRATQVPKRALLCCFNRLLGDWLRVECAPLAPLVRAQTVHSLLLQIAQTAPPAEGGNRLFWDHELPEAALRVLLERDDPVAYDVLIVDEAQDILWPQYLDVFDLLLAGGLARGSWRVFGDFQRQALYGYGEPRPPSSLLERVPSVTTFKLTANCRNTPRIAEYVPLMTGADPYVRVLRPDDGVEPELRFVRDDAQATSVLADVLRQLRREGFSAADIVVLSPRANASAAQRMTLEPWHSQLRSFGAARSNNIRFGTIHAFKGLDSPAVVLTDIDDIGTAGGDALLYVGMTRATDRLFVLASELAKGALRRRLTENGASVA